MSLIYLDMIYVPILAFVIMGGSELTGLSVADMYFAVFPSRQCPV